MSSPQSRAPRPPQIVLASNSPRRRELLAEAGYDFIVRPPADDVECGVCSESGPAGLVAELAYRKAAAVVRELQGEENVGRGRGRPGSPKGDTASIPQSPVPSPQPPTIVVAADTVAECDGFILGKPRDEATAREMLSQLSGREHRVLSGVCVWRLGNAEPLVRVAVTTLRMDRLTDDQLSEYVASGGWEGKAGAFGYQDRLGWVHILEGSESNVVGLPMEMLAEMLAEVGERSEERAKRGF